MCKRDRHSIKAVPAQLPAGLELAAIPTREDPRDALLIRADVQATANTLQELPAGARVGTSSLRRTALLRQLRPDLQLVDLRGNVPTRVKKPASKGFRAGITPTPGGFQFTN